MRRTGLGPRRIAGPSRHRGRQRLFHLVGAREPSVGIPGQRAEDRRGDCAGHLRHGQRPRRVRHLGGDERGQRGAVVGQARREHLVEHRAHRIEVGSPVDPSAVRELLGRHVVRRAQHRAGHGQLFAHGPGDLADPEVEHLGVQAPVAGPRQEDVGGLQISVHHPRPMRRGQPQQDLARDAHGRSRAQPTLAREVLGEVFPLQQFHGEEGLAFRRETGVEDLHDVGAPDGRHRPGLAQEALQHARRGGALWVQHLEGHVPPDHRVPRLVDGAERSSPELPLDEIAIDALRNGAHAADAGRSPTSRRGQRTAESSRQADGRIGPTLSQCSAAAAGAAAAAPGR